MGLETRREFLKAAAAASALAALGARASPPPADPPGFVWTRSVCLDCAIACRVHVGAEDGVAIALKGDPGPHDAGLLCPGVSLPPRAGRRERASTVAGVLFLTAPGAAPRVATRLAGEPALTLTGGDGEARIAAVWETDGMALDLLVTRLMREDPEILRVAPTFVGRDEEA